MCVAVDSIESFPPFDMYHILRTRIRRVRASFIYCFVRLVFFGSLFQFGMMRGPATKSIGYVFDPFHPFHPISVTGGCPLLSDN